MRPTVLVLMGGPDAERGISILSGREVAGALRESGRFNVIDHVIDRPTAAELTAMTASAGSAAIVANSLVIFPVLHGHWGEGGPLQELLEQVKIPYVGSRPKAAALAMDKLATKTILAADHVPTPASRQLMPDDDCDLDPPIVLKPVDDGSSVDLRICHSVEQVNAARAELHPRRGRLLAERYIRGREITAGIIGDEPLPLIEIIPSSQVEFYDYQAKYFRDDTRYVIDPDLPPGVAERCIDLAMLAFRRLGCRDVARVDFMVDECGPWFLEINTMPGFTTHSLVPMAARSTGLAMPDLCAALVDAALARAARGRATASTSG